MVIFGAGASYDSVPTYPPGSPAYVYGGDSSNNHFRPPLANELFENRPMFAEAILKYPECQPIVPRLRTLRKESLEEALADILEQSKSSLRALKQLAAVRCYLQRVIRESEDGWRTVAKGVTNYKSLLNLIEIAHTGNEPVCLVTFNYDTLLEDALYDFGLPITSIDDYTKKHPYYRIFKLHGSINWAREVQIQLQTTSRSAEAVIRELIERANEMHILERYVFARDRVIGLVGGIATFPAIAVPVEKKTSFECPAELLKTLADLLPEVTRMLVIGWRGTEMHFLELLKQYLRKGIQLYIVAGRKAYADTTSVQIHRALVNKSPYSSVDPGGFTDFILDRRAERFLQR